MSITAKRQIIQALDDLSEQSLAAVAEFVDFLRAKAVAGPAASPPPRVVKLGGLWTGEAFSEQDIDEARVEAWSGRPQAPSVLPRAPQIISDAPAEEGQDPDRPI